MNPAPVTDSGEERKIQDCCRAEKWRFCVIGGLAVSTLLTLVVVPCSYLVIKGAAARLRAWVLGVPMQEEAPAAAD
jgi:hypothetical protein